uniref:Uncharacterized protein n=1 Tax=Opuntia streptacantha TaxID=393608 RepID=A0A7C9CLD1_OPUST
MAEVEGLNRECGQGEQQEQHQEEKERDMGAVKEELKPWEQHAAVISIPRFDYNAPSSLLHYSHPGFLITCPFKREKSATKEAISILEKYLESNGSECLKKSDASSSIKRRKLCSADAEPAGIVSKANSSVKQAPNLLLVKVTRSGLVLLTLPKGSFVDPVGIVSHVNQSLESGVLKRPVWCHRIFPIQATCQLSEKEVTAVVSELVLNFVDDEGSSLSRPLKFAVGYNRRGIEETEMKAINNNSSDPNLCALLVRNKCFSVVAAAVKAIVPDSVVDLKSPELCILIELLPLSGVPAGLLVTAVSVLPRYLVSTKPRLCIKALVCDSRAR